VRQRKKRTAWLALLGFVLAQMAAAAYACATVPDRQRSIAPERGEASAMMAHCSGMAEETAALPNLCQAHCQASHQIDSQLQAPAAAMAPPPALTVTLSDTGILASAEPFLLRPFGAAPPPSILFSRLLI
jgi:hypothetical protein